MHYPGHGGSGMARIFTQFVLFLSLRENPPKCKPDRGFHHWYSLGQWCQFKSDLKSCLQLGLSLPFQATLHLLLIQTLMPSSYTREEWNYLGKTIFCFASIPWHVGCSPYLTPFPPWPPGTFHSLFKTSSMKTFLISNPGRVNYIPWSGLRQWR